MYRVLVRGRGKPWEQKSLTLAPEAQVGLAVTLWPAVARCGLGEMPEGGRRGDPPSQWEPTREPKALTDRFFTCAALQVFTNSS